jgi:hypothetical protein
VPGCGGPLTCRPKAKAAWPARSGPRPKQLGWLTLAGVAPVVGHGVDSPERAPVIGPGWEMAQKEEDGLGKKGPGQGGSLDVG